MYDMNKYMSGPFSYRLQIEKEQDFCKNLNLLDLKALQVCAFKDKCEYRYAFARLYTPGDTSKNCHDNGKVLMISCPDIKRVKKLETDRMEEVKGGPKQWI